MDGFGEKHLLGEKAVEQRHPGHGRGGHHGEQGGARHEAVEAVDAAHVAGAGLVVDDARGHEQRGLEGGVVDDVKHRRHRGHGRVQAEQEHDQAEVADGRVGQQSLEIVLEQGHVGAEQQGDQAGATHQEEPGVRAGQDRVEPGEQEHAGLDHGGRVQVGAHRGGRLHGVRQPEMEGELGRLGKGAGEDERQHGQVEIMAADQLARLEDRGDTEGAGHVAEQEEAGQERQAAAAGHGQGHVGAAAGLGAVVPEADEEETAQRGHLPEDEQQQQVVAEHHPEHGPHEQQQQAEEAADALTLGQVLAGIEDDQQADAEHEQHEQGGQAVQAQVQVEPGRGQPGETGAHRGAGEHAGERRQGGDERGQGAAGGGPGSGRGTEAVADAGRRQGGQEGQEQDEKQVHGRSTNKKNDAIKGVKTRANRAGSRARGSGIEPHHRREHNKDRRLRPRIAGRRPCRRCSASAAARPRHP